MGGCRCVYRKCTSSTTLSPGLHYFHFPVRDPARCEQWIENARKPDFRTLDRDKLRNKVVCSLHFESKCFTNTKQDRLIHNAVPTLGFEDEEASSDPLQTSNDDSNIMLIPIDEDNTKFALPDVDFSGMSYTICDDAVIPTSNVERMIKTAHVKPVIKTESFKKNPLTIKKITKIENLRQFGSENSEQQIFLKAEPLRAEVKILSSENGKNNNIQSYSLSTLNGDVSLQPSNNVLPEIITGDLNMLCEFKGENSNSQGSNISAQIPASFADGDFSLQFKGKNEYTMSVNPVSLEQNDSSKEGSVQEGSYSLNQQHSSRDNSEEKGMYSEEAAADTSFSETAERAYIRMIKHNSRQIRQLKLMVQKQNKLNRLILQRKQIPRFRRRRMNKAELLESLKEYVKPSLLAILKLEMLPVEEVVLSDSEEKFITDLYMENPECYDLLRTKWKWNLPTSEKIDETPEGE